MGRPEDAAAGLSILSGGVEATFGHEWSKTHPITLTFRARLTIEESYRIERAIAEARGIAISMSVNEAPPSVRRPRKNTRAPKPRRPKARR